MSSIFSFKNIYIFEVNKLTIKNKNRKNEKSKSCLFFLSGKAGEKEKAWWRQAMLTDFLAHRVVSPNFDTLP